MPGRAGRNRIGDAHYYWNNTARTKPEAQALATRLGLNIPTDDQTGLETGLVYPIRRLIITGEDNPTNFNTLLGPKWEVEANDIIKQTRIEALLCPPPGSASHAVSEHLDIGCPRWTPRGPNAEEEVELEKVKAMQQRAADYLGDRKGFHARDLKEILSGMGGNWVENLPTLEAALNGME